MAKAEIKRFQIDESEKNALLYLLNNYFAKETTQKGEILADIGTLWGLKIRLQNLKFA